MIGFCRSINELRMYLKMAKAIKKISNSSKEFLSIRELAERIPYSEGTVRNMISDGDFIRGIHYVKPKGRVIFRWSRVVEWIESEGQVRFPGKRRAS